MGSGHLCPVNSVTKHLIQKQSIHVPRDLEFQFTHMQLICNFHSKMFCNCILWKTLQIIKDQEEEGGGGGAREGEEHSQEKPLAGNL